MSRGWQTFAQTVLHFEGGGLTLDLRQPVTQDARLVLQRILAGPFGIVTAYNPFGILRDADVNAARAAQLEAQISALWLPYRRVDGCSPDGAHCERSLAIAMGQEALLALARDYQQLAIFWYDGMQFWIVPATSPLPAAKLPIVE